MWSMRGAPRNARTPRAVTRSRINAASPVSSPNATFRQIVCRQRASWRIPRSLVWSRLLVLAVAGQVDDLEPVPQCRRDPRHLVRCRDEQHLGQVERQLHERVAEAGVLRRVEHLEQHRGRLRTDLVDLVEHEDRVPAAHPPQLAQDEAGNGSPPPSISRTTAGVTTAGSRLPGARRRTTCRQMAASFASSCATPASLVWSSITRRIASCSKAMPPLHAAVRQSSPPTPGGADAGDVSTRQRPGAPSTTAATNM